MAQGGYAVDLQYAPQVRDFLQNSNLKDVKKVGAEHLVVFEKDMDLDECFKRLVKNNIHSAPVYDPDTKKFVGLLDWKDFATYVVKLMELTDEDIKTATEIEGLIQQKAISLVDLSKQNPFIPLSEDSSMLTVLEGFGAVANEWNIHRRPVVSKQDSDKVVSMLSQMDIIKWLANNKDNLGPEFTRRAIKAVVQDEMRDKRLHKLRFVSAALPDFNMLEVIKMLVQHFTSALAVVDHRGKLIGNISASDLQFLVKKGLDNLNKTVGQFLEAVPRKPLITCSPDTPLGDVVDKLAQEGVYRIYVVSAENEPVSVITLTDIINAVLLMATPSEVGTGLQPK